MKITNIEYNDYKMAFISIEIEDNESCNTIPFERPDNLDYYPISLSGTTHHIEIRRDKVTGFTGKVLKVNDTWNLGCGSGAAMGWTLGLDLETAKNTAKGWCKAIETNKDIAAVYHNVKSTY